MKAALDTMLSVPEFDLVVAVIGSSARFQAGSRGQAGDRKRQCGEAAGCVHVPDAPEALAKLAQAGVPSFRTPECCADAIAAAFRRRASRAPQAAPKQFRKAGASQLNEWDAYELFEKIGLPHAPAVRVAIDAEHIELPFGYPVAVKVLSEAIAHKTDVGGVILNIAGETALKDAIGQIVRSIKDKRPDIEVKHVLVQPMTSGLGELLLGYKKDVDAGPIVLLAAGGIFTEIYRTEAFVWLPSIFRRRGR